VPGRATEEIESGVARKWKEARGNNARKLDGSYVGKT
jgi:hypothetical protein